MSYEGREAYICENGHVLITECDLNEMWVEEGSQPYLPNKGVCYHCEGKLSHVGAIDDTNCDAVASFYFKKIKDEEPVNICPCCNRPEKVIPPCYEVIRPGYHGSFEFDSLKKFED
jgi:hypothetical protein